MVACLADCGAKVSWFTLCWRFLGLACGPVFFRALSFGVAIGAGKVVEWEVLASFRAN